MKTGTARVPAAAAVFAALLAAAGFASGAPAPVDGAADSADALVARGEAIYRAGVLESGAPLQGVRSERGQSLAGAAAACVSCHRHSGLGSQEGGYLVPPISASYLFHADHARTGDSGLPYVPGARLDRPGYTEETLARALRDGIDSAGQPLGFLMPRFALGDGDMRALIAYLRTLAPQSVPGVTPTVLHFATIITPDADPVRRQGVLDVLKVYFDEKNTFPFGPSPAMHASSGRAGASKSMYMANRRWQLHVWQLEGPADTWQAQLQRFQQREPVMAVISGLGGTDWSPVHAFCEQAHMPCLFPNAEVPVVADQDFYSLYLSKGVLLEAQLMARHIGMPAGTPAAGPVRQVYRAGDSGEAAARALSDALRAKGQATQDVVIASGAPDSAVREAIRGARGAALVLWLRPGDLQALADVPAPAVPVFVSGLMGGLENAPLPPSWRDHALLSYPFDLPDRRVVRVDYPLGWFRIRHIPVVAEQVQVDTYLACGLLSETLNHMSDNFGREYLVERMEEMLGHRILTGYYPRLSLAEGQRFASKGGYLVQLTAVDGKVVPSGDWTVP